RLQVRHHRRRYADRLAEGSEERPDRVAPHSQRCARHRLHRLPRRGRGAPSAGGAHRRRLREERSQEVVSSAGKKAAAKPKPVTPSLSLSVQYACEGEPLPSRPQVRRWVKKALEGASAEVTVRFVDAEEGRMLNREYRNKDYATNVLSFPYMPNPEMAGDLVLCLPVMLREAAEQRKPAEAHFAHLI